MIEAKRRTFILAGLAACGVPRATFATPSREITWDDLIPPGIPYAEVMGEGDLDEVNDTWNPIFDENATKLNAALHGMNVRIPGFVIPIELDAEGVTEFVLVPNVGACIHTPPPPPNQLILVRTADPWPSDDLWEPVWVEGMMSAQLVTTEVAETGYTITANNMEIYEW